MKVANKTGNFVDNAYRYDAAGNILQVVNSAAPTLNIGGTMSHTYTYDDWHRLKTAVGNFKSADGSKSADYTLNI